MSPYTEAGPSLQEKNAAEPKINTYAPAFFRLTAARKPAIILAHLIGALAPEAHHPIITYGLGPCQAKKSLLIKKMAC